MSTATTAPTTRRIPGWERVLSAFMAAPDRTLTNVELGQIPGVQAFHQRIQDARRYGYFITDGVLVKKGRYAYTLVGVSARLVGDRVPDLPRLAEDRLDEALHDAYKVIRQNAEALAKREKPPIQPAAQTVERTRMVRGAVAALQEALGDHVADWPTSDQGDLLALTHKTCSVLEESREVVRVLVAERSDTIDWILASAGQSPATITCATAAAAGSATLPDLVASMVTARQDEEQRREDALSGVLALLDEHGATMAVTGTAVDIVAWARERLAERTPAAPRAARAPRADRTPTGPQLMRKALEFHEQPMHSSKIAEWVMANGGGDRYRGATPAATMAAQLATSNKQDDGEFVKVKPGCYALRDWTGKQDQFGNDLLDLEPIR